MRLRDRLAGLTLPESGAVAGARPPPSVAGEVELDSARAERIAQLRALISDVVGRDARSPRHARRARGPGRLPLGELHETPAGPLHVIERWLEPSHCHGRVPVRGSLEVDAAVVAQLALDPSLASMDPGRLLILDTETTGLAGGTGTVPFLVGLAFFEHGALKVEQLFLGNLGGEAPMLTHLAGRLASASVLVSYNGKAFDWPLLRTRFVLNRVPMPALPPHLDLLHCARRLLRVRQRSVRLTEVERRLLGFYREDDVDGAEIPGLYLRYLRGADPRSLLPVITHNQHDVIALAALLERLCARYARVQPGDEPEEHLACARVALRARDLLRAQAFADAAAEGGGAAGVTRDAHTLRAQVAKKRGDAAEAASAWQRVVETAESELCAAHAHLALSRLYERELRDLVRAYRHARFTLPAEGPVAHGRRLGRLWRRLLRAAE